MDFSWIMLRCNLSREERELHHHHTDGCVECNENLADRIWSAAVARCSLHPPLPPHKTFDSIFLSVLS